MTLSQVKATSSCSKAQRWHYALWHIMLIPVCSVRHVQHARHGLTNLSASRSCAQLSSHHADFLASLSWFLLPLKSASVLLHRCMWALMGRTCKLFRQDWMAMFHQEEAQCWWTRFSTSTKRMTRVTWQPQGRDSGRWMPGEDSRAYLSITKMLQL